MYDLLSFLGVYKLPLGVNHVHQRPGAFMISKSAKLFSPLSEMYPSTLPAEFTIIMSIRCSQNFSGYLFALSDLIGNQKIGIKLENSGTLTRLIVEFSNIGQSHWSKSVNFEIPANHPSWQQYAITFADDTIRLHYDCVKTIQKDFQGLDFSTINGNLMMSIGPYFTRYGSAFEGAIEQLVIKNDVISGSQQCSEQFDETVSFITA